MRAEGTTTGGKPAWIIVILIHDSYPASNQQMPGDPRLTPGQTWQCWRSENQGREGRGQLRILAPRHYPAYLDHTLPAPAGATHGDSWSWEWCWEGSSKQSETLCPNSFCSPMIMYIEKIWKWLLIDFSVSFQLMRSHDSRKKTAFLIFFF